MKYKRLLAVASGVLLVAVIVLGVAALSGEPFRRLFATAQSNASDTCRVMVRELAARGGGPSSRSVASVFGAFGFGRESGKYEVSVYLLPLGERLYTWSIVAPTKNPKPEIRFHAGDRFEISVGGSVLFVGSLTAAEARM